MFSKEVLLFPFCSPGVDFIQMQQAAEENNNSCYDSSDNDREINVPETIYLNNDNCDDSYAEMCSEKGYKLFASKMANGCMFMAPLACLDKIND